MLLFPFNKKTSKKKKKKKKLTEASALVCPILATVVITKST